MNTENNKLKEEFNEWLLLHDFRYPEEKVKGWINETNFFNLYKTNWDELMEVVEKIDNLLHDDSFVTIEYRECYIPIYDAEQPFGIECRGETKIQAVYNACLEFIKWLNEQKS